MCYAIPGRLVEIKDKVGIVDYFGEKRRVLVDLTDAGIGDYVYAQGGILINRIPSEEAEEILGAWKELFSELKGIDEDLARVRGNCKSKNLPGILQKVNLNQELSKEDLRNLLRLETEDDLGLLYQTANNIRQKEHRNACCVHGIIEFSNYCRCNCLYCGIREDSKVKRYRMGVDEIIDAARYAALELKFKALVLQSGEDLWYDEDKLVTIVSKIREFQVLVFLSIGLRDGATYKRLFEAGARAALLRFETSNEGLFNNLRPGTKLEDRLELIKYLKGLGYIIATGFLIGLPQEREEDIINNILLTKSLKPDMYSFGPFISAEDTPLRNQKPVDQETILKTLAIARLADRNSKIIVTTAQETLHREARKKGLLSGANSLMINVTPRHYRKLYRIYDGRTEINKDTRDTIEETISLLYSLGRAPADLGV